MNRSMKGELSELLLLLLLMQFSASQSTCMLKVSGASLTEMLPCISPRAAGIVVGTCSSVWLLGPMKWSSVGRERKNNPHKKKGDV